MADTLRHQTQKLEDRIVRYADLKPCYDAFIDTRTPGSDKKENFTIIGPGVSENPNQYVHIAEPHGFNIGGARQPPACTNSQHSHDTVEVFYVHSGTWRFNLGEHGDSAQISLSPGDLISIPTQVFRGFTNIGDGSGFLWAVLGGDDPGRVLWAPKVFDMASEYGLILLDDGMLIDTNKGETIPEGKARMPITSQAQVDALKVFNADELAACCAVHGTPGPKGALSDLEGVSETFLVGNGRMDWAHGFQISEVIMELGSVIPQHRIDVPDVWFVQDGNILVSVNTEETNIGPGDTLTIPAGADRSFRHTGNAPCTLVAVRGGDETCQINWS